MPRTVQGSINARGVMLPGGWTLDAGDQVIVSDAEWNAITSDLEVYLLVDDLGFTSALPSEAPTFRDLQRGGGTGGQGPSAEEVAGALADHVSDTVAVHGIPDTSLLETTAGAQAKADTAEAAAKAHTNTHAADTTNVHGISDTTKLAWNQNVSVATAPDGSVLTKVEGIWVGAPAEEDWSATVNFSAPTDVWLIAHNRGTRAVSVECFDTSDAPVEGNVLYPDDNTVRVEFYYPQSGYVRLWAN